MRLILLLGFFFLLSNLAQAESINCNTLWAKGYPDKRFPEGLDCQFAEKIETPVTSVDVYHYAKDFPLTPDDTGFAFRSREIVLDVTKKLQTLREELSLRLYLKPMTFIFTYQKPEGQEIAMARVGHAGEDETCPVVIYIDPFKKYAPDQQRQLITHEIFHCIQDTMWREKITMTDKRVHEWWVEGSAVWFSNVVYPNANQEHVYNDEYLALSPLVLQKADFSYGAYLFFQSFSNGWLGIDGTIDFINDLPEFGGTAEQFKAVLDFPSIELHFHKFAEEITSNRIKDFNGAFITTGTPTGSDHYDIKEGVANIEWINEILTFKITELKLPPQTIVTIESTVDPDSSVNPMGLRAGGSNNGWEILFSGYPTTVDMSCKSFPRTVEILSSYAGSDPVNESFKLKVKAEKSPCQCVENVEFDKCLIGNYELDKPSLDKVFSRIFKDKIYEVVNSSGSYALSVSTGQKFTFTETDFTAGIILKDETLGDLRVQVTMNGSTDAFGKLLSKDEICFSDIGADYSIRIQVYFPEGISDTTNPYSQFDEFAHGQTRFRCNKDELVIIRYLPTGPDGADEPQELRFIRK